MSKECVVYVKCTQTAAVILNYIIGHEDILENHGTLLLCCKDLKTLSPNTPIFSPSLLPPSSQVIRLIWFVENGICSQCQVVSCNSKIMQCASDTVQFPKVILTANHEGTWGSGDTVPLIVKVSTSYPGFFTPFWKSHCIYWMWGWIGPLGGMDVCRRNKSVVCARNGTLIAWTSGQWSGQ